MSKRIRMVLALVIVCACVFNLVGCGASKKSTASDNGEEVATLKFMYFGSAMEKEAVVKMVEKFEASHPNIKIEPMHVPDSDYDTKMATLVSGNNAPDIAYLNVPQMFNWAQEGKIMALGDFIEKDPAVKPEDRLDVGKYYLGDKLMAMNTAMETVVLYYNKEILEEAGIPTPPTNVEDAWTWEEFVEIAKKLTVDNNGKHPDDPGFDPEDIKQYGVAAGTHWIYYSPFIWSNGADYASEDGKTQTVDSPEFIEAVQKVADLMNVHHVAPNPAQKKSMPGVDIALQTGQIAMAVGGQWSLLDLDASNVNFGIGVLPKLKKPSTIAFGSPTVIFASTEHPEEAWEFYKYHNAVETAPSLFQNGLWMPMEKVYYEDEKLMKEWIDNEAHPAEYQEAVIDFFMKAQHRAPTYTLKNWGKIYEKLSAELDNVWLGNNSAEESLKKVAKEIEPLMEGRYDK